jgi:dihydroorotase-like cyclic amidohydrolase
MFLLRFIILSEVVISHLKAVALAKKQGTLHIFHLSTAKMVCSHKFHWNKRKLLPKFIHLWFPMMINKGNLINGINGKTTNDQKVLWEALDGRIDVVATDPHRILWRKSNLS